MPYDYFCPTVRSQLASRICLTCGLYFATKKTALSHMKALSHKLTAKEKKARKLLSIEAQRENEVLCIYEDAITSSKDSDWCVESDIDVEDVKNCVDRRNYAPDEDTPMPVIESIKEWDKNPWSAD